MAQNSIERTPKSGTPAGMREGMKKATTGMLVLSLLQHKPMYTYETMRCVETITEGVITFNTLYIAIYRLKEHGYIAETDRIVSGDNHARIYFRITEAGIAYLDAITAEYRRMTDAIDRVLTADLSDRD